MNITATADRNKPEDVVAVTQLYRSAGYVRISQGRNAQKRYFFAEYFHWNFSQERFHDAILLLLSYKIDTSLIMRKKT